MLLLSLGSLLKLGSTLEQAIRLDRTDAESYFPLLKLLDF